jgi:ATP-binding cassette subfamily F protein uup
VLLGAEPLDRGTIRRSDSLSVAYFEQNRDALDPQITVAQTLAPKTDHVIYRGRAVHVRSYLDRFLFRPEQLEMLVGRLSGGEQSRLRLAQLMLQPASLLILDEPTNDLDIATLEVLQECLGEFAGAVILVTHDRYFLDQVATEILAFPPAGEGPVVSFAGLAQWESWHGQWESENRAARRAVETAPPAPPKKRKLGFKERRELEGMEAAIQAADARLAGITAESQSPDVASDAGRLTELYRAMGEAQGEVDRLYARWAELEKQKG